MVMAMAMAKAMAIAAIISSREAINSKVTAASILAMTAVTAAVYPLLGK